MAGIRPETDQYAHLALTIAQAFFAMAIVML
jgi:hypothetical protein